ncbi:Rrp42p [Tritrichomonas musculus]|uniref:Ribosomal RNA-processing protein 43 n=1 Tax=Tritrichomonas musculus TaxID=1915356 RepID=A0ABR2IQJ4_9EUKA
MIEDLDKELFHKEYLGKGKRLDGRPFKAKRQIAGTHNCIDDSPGSSLISLGNTIIITKISLTPQPLAPIITVNATRAGVSQIKGRTTQDKTLTATLTLLINRMIPHSELEIARPDPNNIFMSSVKLWSYKMSVNVCVISDDGGIEAASILGFQNALISLTLQKYSLDEEGQIHPLEGEIRKLNFLPINAIQFGILNGALIYDPTSDEEKIIDGCCTIVMSADENPKIMSINTTRTFEMDGNLIAQMTAAFSKD